MKYMLDTNTVIYAVNKNEKVIERILECDLDDLCISSITLAELEYGVCNSEKQYYNRMVLMMFLSKFSIVDFDALAAKEYGDIKSSLKKQGNIIGPNDLLIAAHARSCDLTLVTNNVREFERVEGLKIENWV